MLSTIAMQTYYNSFALLHTLGHRARREIKETPVSYCRMINKSRLWPSTVYNIMHLSVSSFQHLQPHTLPCLTFFLLFSFTFTPVPHYWLPFLCQSPFTSPILHSTIRIKIFICPSFHFLTIPYSCPAYFHIHKIHSQTLWFKFNHSLTLQLLFQSSPYFSPVPTSISFFTACHLNWSTISSLPHISPIVLNNLSLFLPF